VLVDPSQQMDGLLPSKEDDAIARCVGFYRVNCKTCSDGPSVLLVRRWSWKREKSIRPDYFVVARDYRHPSNITK
jgi:hypothetical protein